MPACALLWRSRHAQNLSPLLAVASTNSDGLLEYAFIIIKCLRCRGDQANLKRISQYLLRCGNTAQCGNFF